MFDWKKIDWNDMSSKIAPHFIVHESLWLPSWRIYHIPSDEEKEQIVITADIMENIREIIQKPINVHVWTRPLKVNAPSSSKHGKNYNSAIGSKSTKSAHIFSKAVDFHAVGMSGPLGCEKTRKILIPYLETLNIRMENIQGPWLHIDNYPVKINRFFKP